MSRVLPILFNTEMVQAIFKEPPKTATRRAVKGYIPEDAIWGYTMFTPEGYISCRGTFADGYGEKFFRLPCRKGDILYVREAWAFVPCIECNMGELISTRCREDPVEYNDGESIAEGCFIYRASYPEPQRICWRPSIDMPRQAARIWLKVTDTRVERLQKITIDECEKEGCWCGHNGDIFAFMALWDSTIKKADLVRYGWEANPWVWVIEFERCGRPESEG